MRNFLLSMIFLFLTVPVWGQQVARELRKDYRRAAGNHMAYPEQKATRHTAPPRGKRAFYISHYGRHGSRYHSKMRNYDEPWQVLLSADSAGMLTPLGRDVLRQVEQMRREASSRWGEMSPLGVSQVREIARRMMQRFPEVFEGEARVDAKSTIVSRCILSMEQTLLQMLSINPRLRVSHDASFCYIDYLNHSLRHTAAYQLTAASQQALEEYKSRRSIVRNDGWQRLFRDAEYVRTYVPEAEFSDLLFKLACSQQNTLMRDSLPLMRVFSERERLAYWQQDNAWWYVRHGGSALNGDVPPRSQCRLLETLIADADSCLRLDKPGVQLRFGHDYVIMELLCLMGVNGYGLSTTDLEQLERKGWVNYRAIPMAANVQLVFYRRDAADKDVYVKVLLNEQEATLPLPGKTAPYYRWSDFRRYYLEKIATSATAHE